ncbi:uncharacterized protein LOC111714374 isoform X2 [Eurytemora carolleeae]|uniref:uncharacterized protein LOC111714374 isoform X2 n=1 Tax=Eurytemora carolleeae TaxID=1294199 RepID=UPI000C756D6F|nr:uncharacterized protein LOC111714374 isoform X2 [Eurytemora carolleeae]|eukprot:XP_023345234.1 uncharacterized protein LOC111714374 isoform X2 [Eurytemora affinis]
MTRLQDIFLESCLEGDFNTVARIIRRNRRSWVGRSSFDINVLDKNRRTGLILSCISGSADVVNLLTSRSEVSLNSADVFGGTALMYASKLENPECLEILLAHRDVDPDAEDLDGKTAEDYARECDRGDNIVVLREARAERIRGSWLVDPVEAADSDTDQGTEVETYDESVQNGISLVSRSLCYSNSEPADPITTQLESRCIENFNHEKEKLEENLKDLRLKFESDLQTIDSELSEEKRSLEEKYLAEVVQAEEKAKKQKEDLQAKFSATKKSLELNICLDKFDWNKFLRISNSVSEFECPVCMEEMKPPVKIWQCVDGHPICDICRRMPQVTQCPVCRQDIIGRNILAEKIALSIFS